MVDDWFDLCTCGGPNGCMVHPGPSRDELQARIDADKSRAQIAEAERDTLLQIIDDARAYCEATLRLTDGICLGVNDGDIREERRHMRHILRLLNGKGA